MVDDDVESNLAINKTLTQYICTPISIITVLRTPFAKVLEHVSGSKLAATFAISIKLTIVSVLQTCSKYLINPQMTGHYS